MIPPRISRSPPEGPPDGPLAYLPRWHVAGVIGLLAVHAAMLGCSAWYHSPTIDEPAHLVTGLSYWKQGRFDLYCVNPPFARLAAALPVLFMSPRCNSFDAPEFNPTSPGQRLRGRPEFPLGRAVIQENGERIFLMVTVARWACIPFSLLGAICCYRWASLLYGPHAGLFALTLWCFFPEVLAHGSLITPDMAATSTGVLAGYSYWRWLKQPTWRATSLTGLALGLALLTKTTWLLLLGLWPLLWLLSRILDRETFGKRVVLGEIGMLASILTMAIVMVNAGYLFQESCQRLGGYEFVSRKLTGRPASVLGDDSGNRFRETWLESVPVPFPGPFVRGVDRQAHDFETYLPVYVRGNNYPGGRWWFYLYAAVVKWPLGFWLLLWFSVTCRAERENMTDVACLVGPAIAVCILTSCAAAAGYFRYLLPIIPFLLIWVSRVVPATLIDWRQSAPVIASTIWLTVSSVLVFPHSLSYFNELAGGPKCGHAHLIDCNIDWGQDLLELKRWIEQHPEARPLLLAYHGQVDPRVAGITFRDPDILGVAGEAQVLPGYYAISVHILRGGIGMTYDDVGGFHMEQSPEYQHLLNNRPVARIGYSIEVFRVE